MTSTTKPPGLNISFGALSAPLEKQLKGFAVAPQMLMHFQGDADSITRLLIRNYIGQGLASKMRDKLFNRIHREVQKTL